MASADRIYVDPSALRCIYIHDYRSREFCIWLERIKGSLPITPFGRAELVNSVGLAVFRGDITKTMGSAAIEDLGDDLKSGRFHIADLLWRRALDRCLEISESHTHRLGARTLDVLHVASALVLDCRSFVTYDKRQRALAKDVGLRVESPK